MVWQNYLHPAPFSIPKCAFSGSYQVQPRALRSKEGPHPSLYIPLQSAPGQLLQRQVLLHQLPSDQGRQRVATRALSATLPQR